MVSKKESSWSKFVRVAIWLPLSHWILGLLGMSPGRCCSAMGSWTLWGCSWFISPSFDLHSPVGELRCLHQHALQVVKFSATITHCNQVHIQVVSVWLSIMGDIFSLPATDNQKAFFFCCTVQIFLTFLSSQDVTPTFWGVTLSFQRVILLSRGS